MTRGLHRLRGSSIHTNGVARNTRTIVNGAKTSSLRVDQRQHQSIQERRANHLRYQSSHTMMGCRPIAADSSRIDDEAPYMNNERLRGSGEGPRDPSGSRPGTATYAPRSTYASYSSHTQAARKAHHTRPRRVRGLGPTAEERARAEAERRSTPTGGTTQATRGASASRHGAPPTRRGPTQRG